VTTTADAGRLFVAIARVSRQLRREAPMPLSHGSISALATVVTEGPIRVGDLATWEGVRTPTMTRIVDTLAGEAMVERVPDPADGRACLVRATPAGEAFVQGARSARSDVLANRVSRLPADLQAALSAALPALEALCDEPAHAGPLAPGHRP
jgi:DNA-binding MarR family transcriptional regulator